jgi:hypothetical protein
VYRTVCIPPTTIDCIEGLHFEKWIKEIAEDRSLLLNQPKISDGDLIASQPSSNTLILGSCKSSETKNDIAGLVNHWEKLENHKKALLLYLKLDPTK